MKFTVLTVNLHKGFGFFNRRFILHELREAVRAVSADVVFLQEVLGEHELHAARIADWPRGPHYEFLADSLWSDFAYGRNAVYPQGHHGNALLSKFAITRHTNHDVSIEGPERRGLLHSVLKLADGRELHAICVHLGLRESHRQRQVERLCHVIDSLPPGDPVIVAGDFNDWRQRAHKMLSGCAGLAEVFVKSYGSAARTFPSRFLLLALDRIYVRGAAVQHPIVLPRKPWSHLSDHAPLAAEISL
ncbi:endonuclease/exonuclease/phosphatase family protein [Roseateles chitinivorans]|uniref:endonuclease/exonuclease/phosphatase family protein n=1 Tax=Roseateles chitinivorans TaxID=2917965 RepID=UPI003D66B0FD